MLSLDIIRELAVYAMEQDQPNSMSMIFPPKRLQDLFRESIGNLNFTEEQIRQWVKDIIQDLKERHVGYRGVWQRFVLFGATLINITILRICSIKWLI